MCQAGAPRSMARATPAVVGNTFSSVRGNEPPPPKFSSPPEQSYSKPAYEPKPPKPPKAPREVGEPCRNIFAVLGLVFAFFYPPCGVVLSLIGLSESKKTGSGLVISVLGVIFSFIVAVTMYLVCFHFKLISFEFLNS